MSSHPDKEGKDTNSTSNLQMTASEFIEQLRLDVARRDAKDQANAPEEKAEIGGFIGKDEVRTFVNWLFSAEAQELAHRIETALCKQETRE